MIEFVVPIDEKIVPEEYIDAMRKRYTERRRGRWVSRDGELVCSVCGNPAEINCISGEYMESPYCSECGSRMEEC